jgi:fructose-bisphosphate aldolase class I
MSRVVPAAVPGLVFLSGGQSPEQATERLNVMNALGRQPWELSFSYGRALQAPALQTWKGDQANNSAAQDALYHRAKCNGYARYGRYTDAMEGAQIAAGAAEHFLRSALQQTVSGGVR